MADEADADLDEGCLPLTPFLPEWNTLFKENVINLRKLEIKCITGYFRKSQLRSIAWRQNLKILPPDKSEWIGVLKEYRNVYETTKHNVFIPDPRSEVYSDMSIEVCNPLFTSYENPWHRMFDNQSLLHLIKIDLERTFPEIEFFQNCHVRKMLTDILVVASKLCPERGYLQGMQEVLAPFLMVVIQDQRTYKRQKAANALKNVSKSDLEILDYVNDISFAEHDAFAMFQKVMEITGEWHGTAINRDKRKEERELLTSLKRIVDKRKLHTFHLEMFSDKDFHENKRPRRRSKDDMNPLEQKMDYLHFELLPKYDRTLSYKFEFFTNSFAAYGFRFLPLMFVREFSLVNGDLLLLWDAIFASNNGKEFVLIDYIFIAILLRLRDEFMNGGYLECHCLMSCELKIDSVENIIKFALALRWPNEYKIPDEFRSKLGTGFSESFRNAAKAALCRFNAARKISFTTVKERRETVTNEKSTIDGIIHKWGIFSRLLGASSSSATPAVEPKPEKPQSSSTLYVGGDNLLANKGEQSNNNKLLCNRTGADSEDPAVHRLLMKQVAELQTRLNDFDFVTNDAIKRLDKCICFLCDTFVVLNSKLSKIEATCSTTSEMLAAASRRGLQPNKRGRRAFKSEGDYDVCDCDCGFRDGGADISNKSFKTIRDITAETINGNSSISTSNGNDSLMKGNYHDAATPPTNVTLSNDIEVEPDTSTLPMFILMEMLRGNINERRDRLVTELVSTYARLLRVTTGDDELAAIWKSYPSCESSLETEASVSPILDSLEPPITNSPPLPTKSRRKHTNSTSSTKSSRKSHLKSRKRFESSSTTQDEISCAASTLRRYKDPTLPEEIAIAMALNSSANAHQKVSTKGVEFKIMGDSKTKEKAEPRQSIPSLSARLAAQMVDSVEKKLGKKRMF